MVMLWRKAEEGDRVAERLIFSGNRSPSCRPFAQAVLTIESWTGAGRTLKTTNTHRPAPLLELTDQRKP